MNDDMDEFYQERAAIIEHMAGYPRAKAEALARAEAETYRKQREAKEAGE